MRRFSSYGPVNHKLHFYVPRKELIESTCTLLLGEKPDEGGHYITVWAPRQCGKSWVMREVLFRLKENSGYDVLKINLEHLKDKSDTADIIQAVAKAVGEGLNKDFSGIRSLEEFQGIFHRDCLDKPLILILDEFDALAKEAVNGIVSAFRNIYINRLDQMDKNTGAKSYLLHAAV